MSVVSLGSLAWSPYGIFDLGLVTNMTHSADLPPLAYDVFLPMSLLQPRRSDWFLIIFDSTMTLPTYLLLSPCFSSTRTLARMDAALSFAFTSWFLVLAHCVIWLLPFGSVRLILASWWRLSHSFGRRFHCIEFESGRWLGSIDFLSRTPTCRRWILGCNDCRRRRWVLLCPAIFGFGRCSYFRWNRFWASFFADCVDFLSMTTSRIPLADVCICRQQIPTQTKPSPSPSASPAPPRPHPPPHLPHHQQENIYQSRHARTASHAKRSASSGRRLRAYGHTCGMSRARARRRGLFSSGPVVLAPGTAWAV